MLRYFVHYEVSILFPFLSCFFNYVSRGLAAAFMLLVGVERMQLFAIDSYEKIS